MPTIQTSSRLPILQVLKTAVAAIAAWLLCNLLLGQPLPIFAAIAALLVVQPSVNQSLLKGVERSIGVIAGVVLAYVVGLFLGNDSWIVLSVIVVSLLIAWAFRLGPGSANQIPISAMLVLALGTSTGTGTGTGTGTDYAIERILETIIGAAIGLAVNLAIVPPVLLGPAHLAVSRLLRETASVMDQLADNLREPQTDAELAKLLANARKLRALRDAAAEAIANGEESLTLNPRRGRHRRVLERDQELFNRLTALVTQVLGMARAVHDRYDETLSEEPTVRAIVVELGRAAHDLRLLGRDVEGTEPSTATAELPALTAPLAIARPDPKHWVLIGSLLEDLRRMREGIVGESDG